ncbi:hypothetical protein GCM10022251_64830 [Phytohabitans flavus]|uniref:Uncharacterized protein n=1 Tax=Phytohabitans flavus TaxID=1076124 RepID=A0A6F8XU13_9ACTN|nr:hypothetical protein Pflav_037340 [Phytohabitans flavus]
MLSCHLAHIKSDPRHTRTEPVTATKSLFLLPQRHREAAKTGILFGSCAGAAAEGGSELCGEGVEVFGQALGGDVED